MMLFQKFFIHPWFIIESFKVCFTDKTDQILITSQISSQEDQVIVVVVGEATVFGSKATAWCHVGFASDDRFDTGSFGFPVELDSSEHVAMVGHRHSRLIKRFNLLDERLDLIRAI